MNTEVTEKVAEFFGNYPARHYPKGQILIFAKENPEHVFYITKGVIREYDVSYRGDEIIVNLFKPGAFFPMSWVMNKTENDYFYKTETETDVHLVPPEDALKFVKDNPDVMFDLMSRLYRGMDGLLGRIVRLMSGSAKSRLLYEIIVECRRFGEDNGDDNYNLTINETDLAARSGLTRETVSREIKKMKAENLIKIDNKGIHVPNLTNLEKKLGASV